MKKGNGEMRPEQHLYPDVVYRFNEIFQTVWQNHHMGNTGDVSEDEDVLVIPVFFSKGSRTFHWICLDSHMWNWEETLCREHLIQFIEAIKDIKSREAGLAAWELFCENQPSMDVYKEAIKTINEAVCDDNPNLEQIHRAILLLYSGFHHEAEKNIEGVFYNFLTTCSNHGDPNRSNYLEGELLEGPPFKKFLPKNPCSADCKERDCLIKQSKEIDITNQVSPALLEIFTIFVEHLRWHRSTGQDAFGNRIIIKNQVALLPLYDVWIGDRGYGGIKAVFIVFFDNDKGEAKPRKAWLDNTFPKLRDAFQELAEEVTASAETLAASLPITPPYDLVRHFLKALVYVQDWQSAAIFNNDGRFLYEYKRTQKDSQGTLAWEEGGADNKQVANEADNNIQECNGNFSSQERKRYYMWWTAGEKSTINLWSKEFLPDLSDEEVSRFCNLSIRFEFPEATHIPSSKGDRSLLYQEYLRQQLDLMRMLIPKVRARRAALRSAVSAIMGRNMSHNIGSHVLARYSSRIKEDLGPVATGKTDHRGDFLAYLQRRMDFLAEIATSDQAFWSQPLSLKEQIGRLNYEEQKGRFGTSPPDENKSVSIILSNITGKESLLASVEYVEPCQKCAPGEGYSIDQEWFSCPSGEVGVHALFVILENIIRNSARHGASGDSTGKVETVRLFANVVVKSGNSELFKLEIIDPRTKLEKDGRRRKGGEGSVQDAEKATAEEHKLVERGGFSLFDEHGKREKLISLPREINSILHDEPFLDAAGNPHPQFWGIREMQICAHYLRGFALSDMEGERDEKNPVLEAGIHTLPDNSFCLKYTLYLQRAKLMAAVFHDDSAYRDRTNELRGRGIVTIGSGESGPDWAKIARDARGYGFLVVEDGIEIPEDRCVRASLPVRTFSCSNKGIGERIEELSNGVAWMEPLHRCWAEMCRNRRGAWAGKPLWGVAIDLGSPNLANGSRSLSSGLFRTSRGYKPELKRPLPRLEINWHNTLQNSAIAAAWIDHPKETDFYPQYACLGHASQPNGDNNNFYWISAEGAFSDGAHTAYLKTCRQGEGWEILAAAVARVAVLDERVQSELNRMSRSNIQFSEVWPLMGVWIPAKDGEDGCNLDSPMLNACNKFLKKPAKREDQFPVDFLVIHLTILERLAKEANESLPVTLSALIMDTEAKDAVIIIVTGRGVPTVASALNKDHIEDVRYLPISALLESLVSRPSKLALMRVIWSAGRPFDKNCTE